MVSGDSWESKKSSQQAVIEEEIHALLQEGSEAGAIEQQERERVRNVFRLDVRLASPIPPAVSSPPDAPAGPT